MTLRHTALALFSSVMLLGAPASNAMEITFEVDLLGSNENPANSSPGVGSAEIVVDTIFKTMSLDISFSGLLGNTTATHIHCCQIPPTNAQVATQTPSFIGFPLGVTSGTYTHEFDMSLASSYNSAFITAHGGTVDTAFADLLAGMLAGMSYLNIHSTMFPGGEIRGALIQVPEPGSLALLGLALAGLAATIGRKKVH